MPALDHEPHHAPGIARPFHRSAFARNARFSVIGTGAIGGKAQGLARVAGTLQGALDPAQFPGVRLTVPWLTVLASGCFDAFMQRNALAPVARSDAPDAHIAQAFLQAALPPAWVGDLWALVEQVHRPLAVRSSSLLEDRLGIPFAGIYATKLIPSHQLEGRVRFALLTDAIKLVYASTFFAAARAYRTAAGIDPGDEKMGVIIQEVIGRRHGTRFYPCLSGVARSFNHYPFGHACPEDGIVNLALGLGRTIVDEGVSWPCVPAYPRTPPPCGSPRELLHRTQTRFWAVNMGAPAAYDPFRETEHLVRADLSAAERDRTLTWLASTWDPAAERLTAGTGRRGVRVLTFAPLLRSTRLPFNAALGRLMDACRERWGTAVEIEFAATLQPDGSACRLGVLQVRPMMTPGERVRVSEADLAGGRVLLSSRRTLGNGEIAGLKDVVYVQPDRFDPAATLRIAAEIATLNRDLQRRDTPYLLIGFGRWGSSDPWLGIPVTWGQISAAKVIVEAAADNLRAELSQGSHFFHNLNGFQVIYISLVRDVDRLDWAWLERQPVALATDHVRHVRIPGGLHVRADGRTGRGVIVR